MNARLALGEKLKDLRNKHKPKLILADVSEATGISVSTLQRLEADDDIRIGYQDIVTLARYHKVLADYLFELTDNDSGHREYEIDALQLSDTALDALKDGQLTIWLISEFIAHSDFPQLLRAMEIYIDRKVLADEHNERRVQICGAIAQREHGYFGR